MAEDFLKDTVDKVADIVDDAISSNDYTNLSREIGSLLREAVDSAGSAVRSAFDASDMRSPGQKSAAEMQARYAAKREAERKAALERAAKEREEEKYFAKAEEPTGAKIRGFIGGAGAILFGFATMVLTVFTTMLSRYPFADFTAPLAVILGILTVCSIAMMASGRRAARKAVRFKSYRNLIMPKLYADVEELSREMQIPEKEVVSDLEGFTRKGMIRQGHFDDNKKTFIASDELYQQYRSSVTRAAEQKRAEEEEARRRSAFSPEVQEILTKGNEYIRMIRQANDDIPDQAISDKLDRMETIVRRIFEEVRERPELAGRLNMFMNYYLPTTTKLVNAYKEMDQQPLQGDNIQTAKKEIEASLDMINDAFEKLLDSFYREQAMDVSSDISVMKMMMKQDGLAEDDMTAMRRKQEMAAKQAKAAQQGTAQAAGKVAAQAQGAYAAAGQVQEEKK